MLDLATRRLARAARKAAEAPDAVLGDDDTPEAALALYEARAASGDPFALGGVGRVARHAISERNGAIRMPPERLV